MLQVAHDAGATSTRRPSPLAPRLPSRRRSGSCRNARRIARAPCNSLAMDAAVTCAIMNPEWTPASRARNGGSPSFMSGCTRRSMRRSGHRCEVRQRDREESRAPSRPAWAVKVAPGEHRSVVEHERVVRRGVQFAANDPFGEHDGVECGAVHLRHAAQGIGIPAREDRRHDATHGWRWAKGANGGARRTPTVRPGRGHPGCASRTHPGSRGAPPATRPPRRGRCARACARRRLRAKRWPCAPACR